MRESNKRDTHNNVGVDDEQHDHGEMKTKEEFENHKFELSNPKYKFYYR